MLRPVLSFCGSLLVATVGTGALSGATLTTSAHSTKSSEGLAALAPMNTSPEPAKVFDVGNARPSVASTVEPAAPPLRIPLPNALLIAPRGCAALGRTFDVLMHFHGAYTTTEPQLMKSGIDAVYVIENLGNFSGPYQRKYAGPGMLNAQLEAVRASIDKRCGGSERSVGRVALSGWSAGYGAIYQILARPADAARVDAVLLADGLHVGFEPGSRRVRGAAMAPFLAFAKAAESGEKLMAITHSEIVPPDYASTSQTANFIVDQLGLPPSSEPVVEHRAGMRQIANAARGGMHVVGFAGGDKKAHCDHLYAISSTLWSRVRDRWARSARSLEARGE